MEKKFRKIGILTSGGDAPGMNAAIKSVTCAAINRGVEVVGILGGYSGLINDKVRTLTENDVALYEAYSAKNLQNLALIVDANHANSGKKPLEQVRIVKEVLHSCRHNEDINKMVKGFMIESYIEDGAQKIGEGIYGKSITDPCIGWDKTQKLVLDMADLLS